MRQSNNRKVFARSRQEAAVRREFPTVAYETLRLPYVQEHTYIPDFYLFGGVCLELKEYMTLADCAKYEAIAKCNIHIKLMFWIQKCDNAVLARLRSNFIVFHGTLMPLELRLLLIEESKRNANNTTSTPSS